MAVTVLTTSQKGTYLMFSSQFVGDNDEEILVCKLTAVDKELTPLEPISSQVLEIPSTEELFHKDLRDLGVVHKTLITSHSTHPEWTTPDYIKLMSDED